LPGRALGFFPGDPAPPWRKPRPACQRSAILAIDMPFA
jgi:hypothetical protein